MSQLQLINNINSFPRGVDAVEYLKNLYCRLGVRVNYEKSDKPGIYNRIMLSTFKRSCSFKYSGTILGYNVDEKKYVIVSVPHPPPSTQFKISYIQRKIDSCSTIQVQDGTTVTLYYYNGDWKIGTHRGIDVGDIKWFNGKSYKQVLNDVLGTYDFKYSDLDTNKCYTIGFKHDSFHMFLEGKDTVRRAWFICSVDIIKFCQGDSSYISYDEDIGIPIQEMKQTEDIKELVDRASTAYDTYIKSGEVNYGYILKIGRQHYLIESSLLANIRQIFYSNKFRELKVSIDKVKYITVYSFLSKKHYDIFRGLFPQYAGDMTELDKIVVGLAECVMSIADGRTPNNLLPDGIMEEAQRIYNELSKKIRIDSKHGRHLIYSYLYDVRHTDMLYRLKHT